MPSSPKTDSILTNPYGKVILCCLIDLEDVFIMLEYLEQLEEKITSLTGRYTSLKEENTGLIKRAVELESENRKLKESRDQAKERLEALIKKIEGMEER